MKLFLSGSFYCFIWWTSNFSTTECRTGPLLLMGMWLCTGRCCHNQNQTFSRKTNHLTISWHKRQLWFIEIMLETYPLGKTRAQHHLSQNFLLFGGSQIRTEIITDFCHSWIYSVWVNSELRSKFWCWLGLEWSIIQDSFLLHETYCRLKYRFHANPVCKAFLTPVKPAEITHLVFTVEWQERSPFSEGYFALYRWSSVYFNWVINGGCKSLCCWSKSTAPGRWSLNTLC